jgi:hypothetical protein
MCALIAGLYECENAKNCITTRKKSAWASSRLAAVFHLSGNRNKKAPTDAFATIGADQPGMGMTNRAQLAQGEERGAS